MTRDEALAIIEAEHLDRIVWFEDPTNETDVSGIGQDAEGWFTYATNERATLEGLARYDNEDDALDDLIKRARGWQTYQRFQARRSRQPSKGDGLSSSALPKDGGVSHP